MDALQQVRDWPVDTSAVGVVDETGRVSARDPGAEFAWASVTKILTAMVVLRVAADGGIDLDEPAGPPGSTVHHLLAHASGLAPDGDVVLAPPGRQRIYSNQGYEVLAELVAARGRMSFGDRLKLDVLEPLGMTGTRLVGSPAHGARGPLVDLIALGRELLRPAALEPALVAEMSTPAFPELPGVLPGFGRQVPNVWGLGPEIRGTKNPHWTSARNSPRTFGHFGRSGSFLWVDPDAGVACGCLTDRDFGPWAAAAWPALSDAVLIECGSGIRG